MSDINIGAITEALNDKSDRDLRNVDNTAGADAVIEFQAPTAQNNYTWYRKYKSGWVEQGGVVASNIGTSGTISLPVEMADANYTVTSNTGNTAASGFFNIDMLNRTVTTINWSKSNTGLLGGWQVSGMAA